MFLGDRLDEGFEGTEGGMVAAHAVDAAAGWGRRGAEEDLRDGGAVEGWGGAEEELARGHRAAGEIAADEVGVAGFEVGGEMDAAGENAVAEAGGEALDLGLDGFGYIHNGAVRDVRVAPGGVLG